MGEVKSNSGIDDTNVRYNSKIEGHTTRMSYMNKLFAIAPLIKQRIIYE